MAGYSVNTPVTPSRNKRKSLNHNHSYSFSGVKRSSTPHSASRIQKAKSRFTTHESMERDAYLSKYIKPNITANNYATGKPNFVLREINRPVSIQRPSISHHRPSFNLVHLINSNNLTALKQPKISTVSPPVVPNPEIEKKVDVNKFSSYQSKTQYWKISSKSDAFKKLVESRLELVYPSKTEKIVDNNLNNIRDTRLVEKLNCLNVIKEEGKNIVASLKSFFAPFNSFKFSLRQFIPFQQADHEVSEEALSANRDELVPFTDEMEREIFGILRSDPNTLIVKAFSINIHVKDLQTLYGSNWLNDGVIEFYFNLISSRSQADKYPNVYSFGTFFYTLLAKGSSIGRWARKLDFFSYDYLLVPIHYSSHWRLAVVDIVNKRIEYYDSLGLEFRQAIDLLLNFLKTESQTKKNVQLNTSEWELVYKIPGIPMQNNSYDCGVFACKYAEYIARKAAITFTQEHIPYFRQCMMYEIIHKQLLID